MLSDPSQLTYKCVSTRKKLGVAIWFGLLVWVSALLPLGLTAQTMVAIQQTPRAVLEGKARLVGAYPPEQKLRLVFALRPPHLEEEEQYLNQLQDRNSPLFHKYLSQEEWNARFAPSVEDEQAVASWVASAGLTITQRYPNRLLVDVEAPVATIQKALNLNINTYEVNGKRRFSNDRDPSIPASIASAVSAVMGLNNIEVPHTFSKGSQNFTGPDYSPGPAYAVGSHVVSNASGKQAARTSGGRTKHPEWYYGEIYAPFDIQSYGGYDYLGLQALGHCCNPLNYPNNSPPEASIAIAIWDDYSDIDLGVFAYWFGLATNVQRYFVNGTPQCCSFETTLDVEWSTAMANSFGSSANTAEVHVYEAADNHWSSLISVLNRILADGHARVLSMSWGAAEIYEAPPSIMNAYHGIFNQLLGQGWTLVAASGDGGATTDCAAHLSVSYPASDPDVIAAGGTTMQGGQYGFQAETSWAGGAYGCANNDGGGGGGCSAYYSAPSYQSQPSCGPSRRSVPDLALNADWLNTPQYVVDQRQLQGDGGTSIVAPELAGFFAQENAYLLYVQSIVGSTCGLSLSAPCAPLGQGHQYIYTEGYISYAPHYPFYDVTAGCNGNDITQLYGLTPYCAIPGYDGTTGWGSANMLQLAWTINSYQAGDWGPPLTTINGPQPAQWYNTDQTIYWAITDTSRNGHLPNGVSGFNYFWDADVEGDPYSEPTPLPAYGDQYNPYYRGPQNIGASGSTLLSLMPNNQGCHNFSVRAWDNAGQSSLYSEGPLCYDPYPPYTTATLTGNLQGQYYSGPVLVTLTATDGPYGSGVASTVYQIQGGPWQNYTAPFYVAVPGNYTISFYSTDNAHNVETTQYTSFVIAHNSRNTVTVTKNGTGNGTVTSADGQINCGSICSYNYYYEQQVTLTATPSPGSLFTGWSGCDLSFGFSCMLTVNANRNAVATFSHPLALQFIPLAPCRVVDTRNPDGPFGGPPIQGQSSRDFAIPNGSCNVPSNAAAYSLNVTAIPQGGLRYLTVWPTGLTRPFTSTLNAVDGRIKANASIVPAGRNGAVSVFATNTTDAVLDINGYFVPLPNPNALAFYPLTPCRVADTRNMNGPLGGPPLSGGVQRDFPVQTSSCGIPNTAQAYSMNITVVPSTALAYLTVWPAGQSQPTVSTLNDLTGTIVANAAIVSAGNGGDIEVYPTQDTDLIIDINGYFAAPGQGGLSLYTFAPCRALDTRNGSGAFTGMLAVNVRNGPCSPPNTAQAYTMNATVVPAGGLAYLTLWADGASQPVVSTLNALDGIITSNMAVVPTNNGSIDAFASGTTQLILDISSYFAP